VIVPSIDLQGGKVVQLEQGKKLILERDDWRELAARFSVVGEINVIDLDAAMGKPEAGNSAIVRELCRLAPVNVGGGIRTPERAQKLVKWGARRVIVGSAAIKDGKVDEEALRAFGKSVRKDRLVVAVDAKAGKVSTHGWTKDTAIDPVDLARAAAPFAGGCLFTAIDREGLMGGHDVERSKKVREAFPGELYVAGGISTNDEIVSIIKLGARPVLGMALYKEKIDLELAFVQALDWKKSELIPTVAKDESGKVLMLAFSSRASLEKAIRERKGVYWSRSRNEVWEKGATSGHTQKLLRARFDCDQDALVFTVEQIGPACHAGVASCFLDEKDDPLAEIARQIELRRKTPDEKSYTSKLLQDPLYAGEKVIEEAAELVEACAQKDEDEVAWEAADVLYHALALAGSRGVGLERVLAELRARQK
ncbi:MAG: bifunctional phosphoribosyl-AMP cyclohydrolase/phosphoribosyl-ATP diphosphatase HisIE, partial [Planctomycetota bacterium]